MHGSKSRKESLKNKNRFKNIKNTKIEQFKVFFVGQILKNVIQKCKVQNVKKLKNDSYCEIGMIKEQSRIGIIIMSIFLRCKLI